MYKFFFLSFFIIFNSFSINVKVVATVGNEVITSYDLENKIKLIKLANPDYAKTNQAEPSIALERLIQERLLFSMAKQNNFSLTEAEITGAIKEISKTTPNIKNISKDSPLYQTLVNQVKGEIIFSTILQSRLGGKLDFSQDEITRFKNAYNTQNDKKINDEQSKQILTSMKVNEVQMELLKTLQENTLIEKK